jgi:hypothetical protein
MFEKLGRAAEQAAASVSRRAFLGKVGKAALAAAGAVAGLLATPRIAQALGRPCGPYSDGSCRGKPEGSYCPLRGRSGTCRFWPRCVCR